VHTTPTDAILLLVRACAIQQCNPQPFSISAILKYP